MATVSRMTRPGSKQTKVPRRDVDGIILLDKPPGMTSNRVLQKVKWLFRARKAGHTGSLDPLASGMLPICLGQATKVSAFLLDAAKTYTVEARWGQQTDTADADGQVVAESSCDAVSEAQLSAALAQFRGDMMQIPPMYSALKHNGRRLYELARAGEQVAREPRAVTIYSLEILGFDTHRPVLQVRCSKGTYVRTLVEDIAAACSTLGHVAALRRTAIDPFGQGPLVSLDALMALEDDLEGLDAHLRPVDTAIADWAALELGADQAYYLRRGNPVAAQCGGIAPGRVRLYDPEQRFLGIGEILGDGRVAPRRLFV